MIRSGKLVSTVEGVEERLRHVGGRYFLLVRTVEQLPANFALLLRACSVLFLGTFGTAPSQLSATNMGI
jgi:hypothetical protein